MKILRNLIALSLAIMMFSLVNVNAQDSSLDASAATIEREVQKKILRLPYYEVYDHITFKVNGDTVTLSGKVRNAVNKGGAEDAVKRIAGVRNVNNNIEILPVGSHDESIRRNLYRTLSNAGSLSRYLWTVNPPVRLIVDRGNISLEGVVDNQGDYNMMKIMASGVPGAFSVTNNLVVKGEPAD